MQPVQLREEFRRDPSAFITRKEAAHVLGCGVSTISRYIAEGKLQALRLGRRRLLIYRPSLWTVLEEP
jgi:excisionase family DNA binding protein